MEDPREFSKIEISHKSILQNTWLNFRNPKTWILYEEIKVFKLFCSKAFHFFSYFFFLFRSGTKKFNNIYRTFPSFYLRTRIIIILNHPHSLRNIKKLHEIFATWCGEIIFGFQNHFLKIIQFCISTANIVNKLIK